MHEFTLQDADGQTHRYEVLPHPPTEGFRVCSRIAAAIVDPLAGTALSALARTVPQALKRARGEGGKIDLGRIMDDPEILDSIAGLDFSSTGPALRRAVESLDLALMRDVLRHANRDGKPLSSDLVFDTAYSRNYGELMSAAWKVGAYNRFFGQLAGFGALVSKAMGKATGALSSSGQQRTG